jgi:hypothetical protein
MCDETTETKSSLYENNGRTYARHIVDSTSQTDFPINTRYSLSSKEHAHRLAYPVHSFVFYGA